jgi:RNA polymerase sigma factor (sigma-70 family)
VGIEGEIDEFLLARIRDDGDVDAFGCLYERHAGAACRFARSLCANDADADDLTADAFTGLLASLRRGNGPTELALPYLFASIKHRHWRTAGRQAHETAVARTAQVGSPVRDANDIVEADVVRTALATLPDDVQALLWRTEVDDESVDDAVERHGTSAHNVAVHRHRARRALGTAYLAQHVEPDGGPDDLDPECRTTLAHLASLVRNKIGVRRRRRLEKHLAVCGHCCRTRERLEVINTRLRAHPTLALNAWAAGLATTIKTQVSTWIGTSAVTLAGSSAWAVAMLAPAPAMPGTTDGQRASVVAHTPFEPHGAAAHETGAGPVGRVALPAAASGPPAGSGNWVELAPSLGQPMAPATSEPVEHPINAATTSEPSPPVIPTSTVVEDDQAAIATAGDLAAAGAATANRASRLPPAADAAVAADQDDGEGGSVASGGGGNGQANGADNGKGSVQRETDGNKNGQDDANGPGMSSGQGNGVGNGPGVSSGQGNGVGNGPGVSSGQGNGVGNGPGVSSGQGNGVGNGPGVSGGQGNGNGNGPGVSSGQGHGNAPDVSSGQGNGNGQGLAKGREKQTGGGSEDDVVPEVDEVASNGL